MTWMHISLKGAVDSVAHGWKQACAHLQIDRVRQGLCGGVSGLASGFE
jgi:hypothetical protein